MNKKKVIISSVIAVFGFIVAVYFAIPPQKIVQRKTTTQNNFQNPRNSFEDIYSQPDTQTNKLTNNNSSDKQKLITAKPIESIAVGDVEDKVKSVNNMKTQETVENNKTQYSFFSITPVRDNKVIVNNGKVIFKSQRYPIDKEEPGHYSLSTFLKMNGKPDTIVDTGSNFYGQQFHAYIYEKGITAIANKEIDTIAEIYYFEPMSFNDYIQTYGSDIHRGEWVRQEP